MKRQLSYFLVITVLAAALLSYSNSVRADEILPPSGILNSLTNDLLSVIKTAAVPLRDAAKRLFFLLLPITIVSLGIKHLFKGFNFQDLMHDLLKFLIITGIYFFLLENGDEIAGSILNSMLSIVSSNSTGPTELLDTTINLCNNLRKGLLAVTLNPVYMFLFTVLVIVYEWLMFAIILTFTVNLVTGHALCVVGMLVLGFGSYSKTRMYATAYLKEIIALSLKLMVNIVLIKAACLLALSFEAKTLESMTSGYEISLNDVMMMIFAAALINRLNVIVPNVMASMISRNSNTSLI
ncbi:MAG: type IV secretion system protein [Succinivibrio sp.]